MAEELVPPVTAFPPVARLHIEITLKQASIIYDALKYMRDNMGFAYAAQHSTEPERSQAREALIYIDQLMGRFE